MLSGAGVSGDTIYLRYRTEKIGQVEFEWVFIQYDSARLQYDVLNGALWGPYVHVAYGHLYQVGPGGDLLLRTSNAYYVGLEYEEHPRNLTIAAQNTECAKAGQNESITILVVPAEADQIYVDDELVQEVELNYQYSYPM